MHHHQARSDTIVQFFSFTVDCNYSKQDEWNYSVFQLLKLIRIKDPELYLMILDSFGSIKSLFSLFSLQYSKNHAVYIQKPGKIIAPMNYIIAWFPGNTFNGKIAHELANLAKYDIVTLLICSRSVCEALFH